MSLLFPDPDAPPSVQETFASPKVKLVQADLSQPSLGLLPDDFAAVAETAAAVVHCAADRSFFETYEALQAVNVNSVKELARFALLAGGAPIHFVSSGAVAEYDGAAPPTDGTDGYVASKWAAETFLRKVAPLGLRAYLHRPLPLPGITGKDTTSTTDGTTATGEEDWSAAARAVLEELVSITRQIGTRPDFSAIDGHVDVAPVERIVDDMAASIISSTAGDLGGDAVQVVRHVAQQRLPVEEFARLINEEEALRLLPTMDPLVWFGEAKRAGFGQFMTAQQLVISSLEGKLVTRR
ncbi:polyketide synthase [Chaetomidium leptoderma]|uniref:Polyketide synthase n=1 Tax=Chaetomidium leptoderma TaxID=669021 RepID=A0AAN6VT93_9PEZI|nr:polyketide synthase [Chaetomidium leptoderma]